MLWVLALLAGLGYAVVSARRLGLDQGAMYWGGVCGLLTGLWGGHLMGILDYGTDGSPWFWARFWSGGQTYYGGLLAGAVAVVVFFRLRRLPFLPYADAMAPAAALGYAIGRIGCFLNGDDYGTLSSFPWAVRFPPGTEAYAAQIDRGWIDPQAAWSLPVHPVQLYSSLFGLAMLVILLVWRPAQPGRRFALFLLLCGSGRFGMQFLRGDFRALVGPLSLTQVISLFLVLVGLTVWFATGGATLHAIRSECVRQEPASQ